ncbi:MAG: sel1 repeat family protein [Synergistaceae bacterium]|nr:sel1 repeat family protein [Synergistaceae bacterium]MBQ6115534.1 sel1 repeat family protein [Synergistaceae bacterium]MBQ6418675.1 sel1 repeat family protein [Synergistaceae bacterium]
MIGHMFEYGQGRAKNLASARSWYQEAANRGHDGAKKALERLTEKIKFMVVNFHCKI